MRPGVGPVVVPEVVVARMLAAEEGVGVGHDGLDVRVAHPGPHRDAAALADDLRHRLGADEVVQDGGARGACSSMAAATRAVVVEPDSGTPWSSTRKQRSASPSKARPTSAPVSRMRCCRATRFSGWMGSAGWFGKVPSSSPKRISSWNGRPVEDGRDDQSAHAVGGVGDHLQRRRASPVDKRADLGRRRRRARRPGVTAPGHRRLRVARRGRCVTTAAMISRRPVSAPTGRAPARHSLIPLYWAGLWEAVNMAPGASRLPDAKYSSSVEVRPEVDDVDAGRGDPVGEGPASARRPTAACPGPPAPVAHPAKRANAAPTARARSVFELIGHGAADVVGLEDGGEQRRDRGRPCDLEP